jgi:dTDP-4-dehydrorhamnose 3,5-epimerase
MKVTETGFPGLKIIEPRVFEDPRGYFFESYNLEKLEDAGIEVHFVQDNQSKSQYGVIRGLHYQNNPHAQTKLIRVLQGKIYDVAVDIRKGSPSYGKWFGLELSDENKMQLLIPKGFAHGFSVLTESVIVLYKCDALYHPQSEAGIKFSDPDLKIDWKIPAGKEIISVKDKNLPGFKEANHNFNFNN